MPLRKLPLLQGLQPHPLHPAAVQLRVAQLGPAVLAQAKTRTEGLRTGVPQVQAGAEHDEDSPGRRRAGGFPPRVRPTVRGDEPERLRPELLESEQLREHERKELASQLRGRRVGVGDRPHRQ